MGLKRSELLISAAHRVVHFTENNQAFVIEKDKKTLKQNEEQGKIPSLKLVHVLLSA